MGIKQFKKYSMGGFYVMIIGISLVFISLHISSITETNTETIVIEGIPLTTTKTYHPYSQEGGFLIYLGIALLIGGILSFLYYNFKFERLKEKEGEM